MLATVFYPYQIEVIYSIAFLIASISAVYLAKWTLKSMIMYITLVAVLLFVCQQAHLLIDVVERVCTVEVPPAPV